jgi:hypothetical protein
MCKQVGDAAKTNVRGLSIGIAQGSWGDFYFLEGTYWT